MQRVNLNLTIHVLNSIYMANALTKQRANA